MNEIDFNFLKNFVLKTMLIHMLWIFTRCPFFKNFKDFFQIFLVFFNLLNFESFGVKHYIFILYFAGVFWRSNPSKGHNFCTTMSHSNNFYHSGKLLWLRTFLILALKANFHIHTPEIEENRGRSPKWASWEVKD